MEVFNVTNGAQMSNIELDLIIIVGIGNLNIITLHGNVFTSS